MKLTSLLTAALMAGATILPVAASADGKSGKKHDKSHSRHGDWRGDSKNDRWAQNRGHDNGKHKGWYKNGKQGRDWSDDRWDDDWRHRSDDRYSSTRYDPYYDSRYDPYSRDPRYDPYYRQSESARRQQTKNEWRNLAIAGGLLSVLGLLKNDSTLTFAGAAGALYSAYRYEQDRKSQNRMDRARAYYFGQPHFYRDGQRYERRDVYRDGQRYYQFVRCD